MSGEVTEDDLENSLPSWISDHLGERSYMEEVVNEYPSSPKKDSPGNDGDPLMDIRPPPERETNTMTQGELDHLREPCSFPAGFKRDSPRTRRP